MNLQLIICLLWCAAALIQVWYWLLPHREITRGNNPEEQIPGHASTRMGVSIVVCVHRDVEKLERLLNLLFVQSHPLYEIIIVNDGPQKEIATFLKSQSHNSLLKVMEFDSAKKITPGKKAPLAAGIGIANYDWVLLTDGDCVPGPDWISEMLQHATPDIEMVLGVAPLLRKSSFLNLLQRFDGLMTAAQYLGAAIHGRPYMGVGRNLLYRRSLFDRIQGFETHAHLISGDDDLFVQATATQKNTAVCMEPTGFVYSEAPSTLRAWLFQKRRHLSASTGYKARAKLQTTLFALSWGMALIGLVFIFRNSVYWITGGVFFIGILWLLFARLARRLEHRELIPWFPVLAVSYCIELCTFAILLILPPPKTWTNS